jgi:DNA topoisomerase-1
VDGRVIRDRRVLARIKALAVPPAWTDVWISPLVEGHIQATGRDARRRKQFRYHARWRSVRDSAKYERTIAFAEALPRIRERVEADLGRRGLPREKVLAAVVRLLETTFVRVGSAEYARQNRSFGLTTLRDRHAAVDGGLISFRFRGKHGKVHEVDLHDRRLARIVRSCQELPGQDLFQYLDEEGMVHDVTSDDVNAYLGEISGDDFTAKDFRTWAGTVLAAQALRAIEEAEPASEVPPRKHVLRAVEEVAQRLGNTPSVCRKCYVHPAIIDSYLDGTMLAVARQRADDELVSTTTHPDAEELGVIRLLRDRLTRAGTP